MMKLYIDLQNRILQNLRLENENPGRDELEIAVRVLGENGGQEYQIEIDTRTGKASICKQELSGGAAVLSGSGTPGISEVPPKSDPRKTIIPEAQPVAAAEVAAALNQGLFYAALPVEESVFSVTNISGEQSENHFITFEVNPNDPDRAYFYIDLPELGSTFGDKNEQIRWACDVTGTGNCRIETSDMGIAVRMDDRWIVTQKAQIEYK